MNMAPILFAPSRYFDPGTGSLVIQLVLGVLLAVGLAVRIYWRKIRALFGAKSVEKNESSQDEADDAK